MTQRQNVSSGSPFEPKIGFSRAVRVGQIVAVSGTAPIGPDGKTFAPGDPAAQTARCLEIIRDALAQAGCGLEHVVRTRVFLADISHWQAAGEAHGRFFGEIRPACTFVQAAGFIGSDWLVEIEADAALPA